MRTHSFASWLAAAAVVLLGTAGAPRALAQTSAESFTATGNVKTAAGAAITAPVHISITRWTTDAERDKAVAALKSGGNAALKTLLDAAPAAGTIQIGERKAPLRFARALQTGAGRVITVIAAQPLLHLGAGMPDAKPRAGHDFAVALFEVDAAGKGTTGDFAPAATLTVQADGAFMVQDYGVEAVRLSGIAKK
jgi:hypothetical protein